METRNAVLGIPHAHRKMFSCNNANNWIQRLPLTIGRLTTLSRRGCYRLAGGLILLWAGGLRFLNEPLVVAENVEDAPTWSKTAAYWESGSVLIERPRRWIKEFRRDEQEHQDVHLR